MGVSCSRRVVWSALWSGCTTVPMVEAAAERPPRSAFRASHDGWRSRSGGTNRCAHLERNWWRRRPNAHRVRHSAPASMAGASGVVVRLAVPTSNANWWTRLQPIRTIGEITAKIPIKSIQQVPLYQRIAGKVSQLHVLGMSYKQIGQALNVSPSLARKAHEFGRKKP